MCWGWCCNGLMKLCLNLSWRKEQNLSVSHFYSVERLGLSMKKKGSSCTSLQPLGSAVKGWSWGTGFFIVNEGLGARMSWWRQHCHWATQAVVEIVPEVLWASSASTFPVSSCIWNKKLLELLWATPAV